MVLLKRNPLVIWDSFEIDFCGLLRVDEVKLAYGTKQRFLVISVLASMLFCVGFYRHSYRAWTQEVLMCNLLFSCPVCHELLSGAIFELEIKHVNITRALLWSTRNE